jgi:hypothetical protein
LSIRLLALLCAPALVASLFAQTNSSTLSGTVEDASAAILPGASITLTGEGNGFVRTTTSNKDGFFSFPELTAATFTLEIDAPGFKHYRETSIALDSSEQRSLGSIRLQIGKATESVTIVAEAATVNLASGERSGLLDNTQLDHLALRGRDVFDAISLMPGVVDTTDGRDAPGPTSIGGIYILGGRNDSKNMTVDGVTNLDTGSNGSVHSMPSIDSIAEVKVLMSAYSAESGRNPSSINVITKGGSNQYHGSASWFFRNEALNGNDFFSNVAGKPRVPYRFNIVNYSLGGPVVLPKILHGKHRLFFFLNQEFQQKVVQYGVKTVTVPTALERQGNFSQSYDTNCKTINIKDPQNKQAAFPGNLIPQSRLTATGHAILNIFPLPNYKDANPSRACNYNFYSSLAGANPSRTETLRVDYSPRDNWQLFISLQNSVDSQNTPYSTWVTGSVNFPLTPIVFGQPGRLATLHSTNVITPSLFNEVSVAVSQNTLTFSPLDLAKVDRTKLGIDIPQRNTALNPLNIIPNTIYSVTDNISKIAGTHTLKAGVYFEHTQKIQSANSLTRGTLSFNTDGNNPNDSNNAYANALLGNFDTYAEATARPKGNFLFTNTEFYLQDSWRARRNLSLDIGIRIYRDPPQYEASNQLASFSLAAYTSANAPVLIRPGLSATGTKVGIDPLTGTQYPFGLVGSFVPGIGNVANGDILAGQSIAGQNKIPRGLFTVSPLYVAPRFGFAWDPFSTGRTAVRGGAGIYFDRIQGNSVMDQIGNPPLIFSPTQYYGTFADIATSASSGLLAPNGSVSSLAGQGHQQATYNFSLDIQRQIGRNDLFSVGYTGSMARHLLWQRNINPVPLGANFLGLNPQNHDPSGGANTVLAANFLRRYQGLGDVLLDEFAGTSNYNGLLASYSHRMGSSMNVSLSYTFSKVLDESDTYTSQVDAFIPARSRNYGPAGFDRRQTFSANYHWSFPKLTSRVNWRPAHLLTNGWEISGVTRMSTGGYFTPSYSLVNSLPAPSGSTSETARVDVTDPNSPLATRFAAPAQGPPVHLGNLGRNTVLGPGINNWDLSLYRQIKLTERLSSQLRFETYNTLNHTQYSAYDQTLKFDSTGKQVNPLFDQPTANRPPRRIQLSVRFRF